MKRLIKKNLITLGILLFAFCLTNVQANAKSQTAVNMKVGSKTFKCVFYNNKTAKALLKKMPIVSILLCKRFSCVGVSYSLCRQGFYVAILTENHSNNKM